MKFGKKLAKHFDDTGTMRLADSNDVEKAKSSRPITLAVGVLAFAVLVGVVIAIKNGSQNSHIPDEDGQPIKETIGLTIPGEGRKSSESFKVTTGSRPVDYMFANNTEEGSQDPAEFEAYLKCDDGTEKEIAHVTKINGSGKLDLDLNASTCHFEVVKGADSVFWEFSVLIDK